MSPLPEQDHAPDPRFPVEWLCELFEGSDGEAVGERPEAFQSARRQVRALRSLGRREAPSELDGLVVASLEAGARQRRAAEQVASLPAVPAPGSLAPRVAATIEEQGDGAVAPAVLERLVAERVQAPTESMVRSMAGRLGRKVAPDELEERVRRSASTVRGRGGSWRQGLSPQGLSHQGQRAALMLGAAALVLAVVRLAGTPGRPAGPELRVVRVESLEAMGATAVDRAFLGALTGELPGGTR